MRPRVGAVVITAAALLCACGGSPSHAPAASSAHGGGTRSTASAHSSRGAAAARSAAVGARTAMHLPVGVSRTVALAEGTGFVVLGGLAPGDSTTARVWRVDPATRRVSAGAPLAKAVHDASGALLGGRAFVFGGGAATTVATVQRWGAGGAAVSGHLATPRSDSAAVVVGGTAYVLGGFSGSGMVRDIEATTDGRTFRKVGRLAVGVRYPAVAAVGGSVYVVGGALATTEGTASGAQTADVQRFDPGTGRTVVVARLAAPRAHAMAFTIGGNLYVAGGRHGSSAVRDIQRIDVRTRHVTTVGELPRALSDAAVVTVGGHIWLVGGETAGPGAPSDAVVEVTGRP